MRLADHEYDQAYASAPARTGGEPAGSEQPRLKQLVDRIAALKVKVAAGQAKIDALAKRAEASDEDATRLEFARALQALDQDDLANAQEDLARKGGDPRSNLQRTYQQSQAAGQAAATQAVKVLPQAPVSTMLEQWLAWSDLGRRARMLAAAAQQAEGRIASLTRRHDLLEKLIQNGKTTAPAVQTAEAVEFRRGRGRFPT